MRESYASRVAWCLHKLETRLTALERQMGELNLVMNSFEEDMQQVQGDLSLIRDIDGYEDWKNTR